MFNPDFFFHNFASIVLGPRKKYDSARNMSKSERKIYENLKNNSEI